MRKLCIGCFAVYIIIVGVLAFVWSGKEHLTNDKYNRLELSMFSEKDCLSYKELFDYIMKDDDVSDLTDIEKHSEVIVKAKMIDRKIAGKGVINECEITQVYKGYDVNQTISVYDDVLWNENANYFEGAVPLHENEEYIMFLKPALNANTGDSYIFTSVSFGHFRLRENVKYTAYDMDHKMSVQEACGYDYIAYDAHNLEKFKMLQNEAYTKYK
ncbi:hypothetical protein [Absiella sp. AM29-15]|uniref:hypothetical protein n=1 Tax=Absiella sp. AM29-15 TaxID=2292278 RepID=UPI000E423791|nr:hypothetical protein [Absiella sp. AM29-15]RGC47746.1 hypothetical protein DW761_15225 [Absiella sp. AM29-15]